MKIAFVFVWLALSASAFSDGEPAGRYQLIVGTVDFVQPGSPVNNPSRVILRIDTQTGKTWRYFFGSDQNGKLKEFWSEISNQ